MQWIKTIATEGHGLFVDDGSSAVSILAWIAVTWLARWTSIAPGMVCAIALFVGLALILSVSAQRRTQAIRKA